MDHVEMDKEHFKAFQRTHREKIVSVVYDEQPDAVASSFATFLEENGFIVQEISVDGTPILHYHIEKAIDPDAEHASER